MCACMRAIKDNLPLPELSTPRLSPEIELDQCHQNYTFLFISLNYIANSLGCRLHTGPRQLFGLAFDVPGGLVFIAVWKEREKTGQCNTVDKEFCRKFNTGLSIVTNSTDFGGTLFDSFRLSRNFIGWTNVNLI